MTRPASRTCTRVQSTTDPDGTCTRVQSAVARVEAWFDERGWAPFDYQRRTWDAYLEGRSGLVHTPTGSGKTLAVWLGPVLEALAEDDPTTSTAPTAPDAPTRSDATHRSDASRSPDATLRSGGAPPSPAPPLRVLWVTPLRALAGDTTEALRTSAHALGLPWTVEARTGDTSASIRARQRRRMPTALVTTPESLSLLLSYPDAARRFRDLRAVIVDEWHELLGTKRGVQTELGLARLRTLAPGLRTWGLSATLGNLDEAMHTLLGPDLAGTRITGEVEREVRLETLLPEEVDRFPWAGHMGLSLLPQVLAVLDRAPTTLLFANTRAQAERWYQALGEARPDWADELALHHGSLDREHRREVEGRLDRGEVRCVVATSSLDLGVDFRPVAQVIQVGSPKGIARLLQRAGRSGHEPGRPSVVVGVPTSAFEMVEFAAARRALSTGEVEARRPLRRPLDVLAQHLVTLAAGGPIDPDAVLAEVRTTHAYQHLSDDDWRWTLGFVTDGGALHAYPEYRKLAADDDGRLRVATSTLARRHRMTIGTITSDAAMNVRYVTGGRLGTIEESFIARLRAGDVFHYAGRALELVRVRDLTAFVRKARGRVPLIPRWAGGRLPLSTHLARAVRETLANPGPEPELRAVAPLLDVQRSWSVIPDPDELLIEVTRSREGQHAFVYPFAGRSAHDGLAALVGYRLARATPRTFQVAINDLGFELLSADPFAPDADGWRALLDPEAMLDDLLASLNASELAKRRFREIARVSGLVFPGYPGRSKSARQLQMSSGLLFDVLAKYDPANRLLDQARREVLEDQIEVRRVREALDAARAGRITVVETPRLTPLAFPLWAERLGTRLSTESFADRVARMVDRLEKAADGC